MSKELYIDYGFVQNFNMQILKKYHIIPMYESEIFIVLASYEKHISDQNIENYFSKPLKYEYYEKSVIKNQLRFLEDNILLSHYATSIIKNMKQINHSTSLSEEFLNNLLYVAIKNKASDIHIENIETYFIVRVRINGELVEIFRFHISLYDIVLAIIKLKSHLDLAQKQLFQDARFSASFENIEYDFRVSILPTISKESIVIRILNKNENLLNIQEIGFDKKQQEMILKHINSNNGMILVTGATGSGKTTSMYAILNELNQKKKKIISIEDPVEFNIAGVTQVNINEKIGLTYPKLLKRILRQDPDVILIGEIRDNESMKIALEAALTGHLVITTLHTNSARKTLDRLLDMGVESYLIASIVKLIISQKLVKILCDKCKVIHSIGDKDYYGEKGCKKCNFSGYSKRNVVAEILSIDSMNGNYIRENRFEKIVIDKKEDLNSRLLQLLQNGSITLNEYYLNEI